MTDLHKLTVDGLAQEIRRVDGNHDMGAGRLAEALMPYLERALSAQGMGQHPDDVAVDRFAVEMKAKLAAARVKGRCGWDDNEDLQQHLSNLLRGHVDKGDPRDVANFCCFLWNRGEGIAPAPSAAVDEAVVERVAISMAGVWTTARWEGFTAADKQMWRKRAAAALNPENCIGLQHEAAAVAQAGVPEGLPKDLRQAVHENDAAWNLARLAVQCGAEDNAADGQPQTWTLNVEAFTNLARRLSAGRHEPEASRG